MQCSAGATASARRDLGDESDKDETMKSTKIHAIGMGDNAAKISMTGNGNFQYQTCMVAEPVLAHGARNTGDEATIAQEEVDGERREAQTREEAEAQPWQLIGGRWTKKQQLQGHPGDWTCRGCSLQVFSWKLQCPRCYHWWHEADDAEEAEEEEEEKKAAATEEAKLREELEQARVQLGLVYMHVKSAAAKQRERLTTTSNAQVELRDRLVEQEAHMNSLQVQLCVVKSENDCAQAKARHYEEQAAVMQRLNQELKTQKTSKTASTQTEAAAAK